jgi:Ribbon-helix-helix protein, copG family
VRRTQLYLDDDLWNGLHARARQEGTTISELVRVAVRERYLGSMDARKTAMQAVVGIWKHRKDLGDTKAYVRELRRGTRLKRLAGA